MSEFPEKIVKFAEYTGRKRIYTLIKPINDKIALYQNEYGTRECFDRFDCGLVPKRRCYTFERILTHRKGKRR